MLHLGPVGGTRHHGRILKTITPTEAESEAVWQTAVLATVATTGEGVEPLVDKILAHQAYLKTSQQWLAREKEHARQALNQLIQERLLARLTAQLSPNLLDEKATAVANREIDLYTAVDQILSNL